MSYLIFGIVVMLVTWYVTENNNKAIIRHHEDWSEFLETGKALQQMNFLTIHWYCLPTL